jgi:hypothetical protein
MITEYKKSNSTSFSRIIELFWVWQKAIPLGEAQIFLKI